MLEIMSSLSLPRSLLLVSCIGLFFNPVVSEPLSEVDNGISSEAHDTVRAADPQLQDATNALFSGTQMASQVVPVPSNVGNPLDAHRFYGSGPPQGYPGLPPSPNAVYTPQNYYYNNSAFEYQGLMPGDKHQYLDPYLYSQPNAKYTAAKQMAPPQVPPAVGYDQNGNVIVPPGYKLQSSPVSYQAPPVGGAGGAISPQFSLGNASRSFSIEHGFYTDTQDPRLGRLQRAATPNQLKNFVVPGPVPRARREMPTDFISSEAAHASGQGDLLKQIMGSVGKDFTGRKVGPISLGGKILKREAELTVLQKKGVGKAKGASHRETGSERGNRNFGVDRVDASFETGSLRHGTDAASEGKTVLRREASAGSNDFRTEHDSKTGSKDEKHGAKLKNRRETGYETGSTRRLSDNLWEKQVHRRAASTTPGRKASDILMQKIMHWKEANSKLIPGHEGTDDSKVKLLQRRAASFGTGFGSKASENSQDKPRHLQGAMVTSSVTSSIGSVESGVRGVVSMEVNRLRRNSSDKKEKCLCTSKVPVNAIIPCQGGPPERRQSGQRTPQPKHPAGAMCTTKCVLNILVPCPGNKKNGLSEVPENAIVAEGNNRETGSEEDDAEDSRSPDSAEKNSKREEEAGNESGRAGTPEKQNSALAGAKENEKAQRGSGETEKDSKYNIIDKKENNVHR